MRLEDKVIEALSKEDYSVNVDKGVAYKYAEFEYGEIDGNITISYGCHEVEEWDGVYLVSSETVIDEIIDVDVWCYDNSTGEDVECDTSYIKIRMQ